jgi:hypothetical protein
LFDDLSLKRQVDPVIEAMSRMALLPRPHIQLVMKKEIKAQLEE